MLYAKAGHLTDELNKVFVWLRFTYYSGTESSEVLSSQCDLCGNPCSGHSVADLESGSVREEQAGLGAEAFRVDHASPELRSKSELCLVPCGQCWRSQFVVDAD